MTAFYESTFDTLAKNKDTEAIGLFQINASSFMMVQTIILYVVFLVMKCYL